LANTEGKNQTTIIKPLRGWLPVNMAELWHFKELFYIFSWRDFKVRYKQTAIGITWAVLQPILMMGVFAFFFGRLIKVPSDGSPYPIFVYSGLLWWNYFSNAVVSASNSLVDNEGMVKKIYFPRLLLPLSATITPAVDFLFALVVLFGFMIIYHFTFSWWIIVAVPALGFFSFLFAAGLGSFLAAINVRFRDIRYALPFFIQLLFFMTPVIYPSSLIPARFAWVLQLNPVSYIISTSRSIFLHHGFLPIGDLIIALAVTLAIFFFGIFFFRRTERIFADVV
jgi:lipopolysaccharide transport system permease protein